MIEHYYSKPGPHIERNHY